MNPNWTLSDPRLWQQKPRAVGYVRQEFEEMAKKRTRPDLQEARISAFAEAHKWQLQHVYEDISWASDGLNRPGLVALLSDPAFDILIVDRADRLAPNKSKLDFLLALLAEQGVTCVAATWSSEPLAQHMRRWYRGKGNPVYAQLEAEKARA
jgi:DNA invertase Pin-like site-specific DNA recombinase